MVSIIMPIYNVEGYVAESIVSVINQTYRDWELIIVNDGSTDDTGNVIKQFSDNRIKIIEQENQGVSVARNNGIRAASGECVAFLDGDDLWLPEFLELLTAARKKPNSNFVYCGFYRFWDDGKERHLRQPYFNGNILYDYISDRISVHINTVLLDKSFLVNSSVLFTPGCSFSEDNEFLTKILCLTSVVSVPQELMKYRAGRSGSACGVGTNFTRGQQIIKQIRRTHEFLKQHYQGPDRERVLQLNTDRLNYSRYRGVLAAIRDNKYDLAEELLNEQQIDLTGYYRNLHHLLKWTVIKSRNKFLWKFL